MILHFSHIGLTDGLTFMIPFRRLYSGDSALAAVAAAATGSWTCLGAGETPGAQAGLQMVASSPVRRRPGRLLCRRSGEHHRGALLRRQMPGREDSRALRRDRDGELEMSGPGVVLGEDRPAV